MSRCYEIRVAVNGHKPERLPDICGALQTQWDFDPSGFPLDEQPAPAEFEVSGVDYLNAGMSEREMAKRLTHGVWAANGAYCGVRVSSVDLDTLPPSDVRDLDEGDYRAWMEQGGPENDEQDD